MSAKTAAFLQIIISIVFAIAIVIASHLLEGSHHEQNIIYILIAIWFVPNSWLVHITANSGEKHPN